MNLSDEMIDRVTQAMGNLVDTVIAVDFNELENYDFPQDESFGLQVAWHGELYCFIARFSSVRKNFICFAPEDERTSNGGEEMPALFGGLQWHDRFEESVISYAYPAMLHKDNIDMAGFTGDKKHWPLEDVAAIIEMLALNQKVFNDNIMFYGSSAGGFASIVLAALIKNSKVLLNNPALSLLNCPETDVDRLFELLQEEFDGSNRDEIIGEIKYRLDAMELFKRENYAPSITCYANIKSQDIHSQIFPFIEQYADFETHNTLNIVYYPEDENSPTYNLPASRTVELINLFAGDFLNNPNESASEEGFAIYYGNDLGNAINNLSYQVDFLRNNNNELKNEIESRKSIMRRLDSQVRWFKKQQVRLNSKRSYRLLKALGILKK